MQEEKIKKLSYHNKEEYKYDHSTPPSYLKDFNYPFLKRKDLMYLSSLNSRDYPLRFFKKLNTKRDWSANLYNLDIEKSVPFRSNVFTNKIDFINKLDDIEKSHPNKIKNNINYNKPIFNLNTHDIDGAYPSKHEFSKRITNPVEPVYKLPSCEILEEDPPNKFIRDNIDISDIPGTKPKPIYRKKINNNDDNNYDIIGSHPKKQYERKKFYENYDYTDVNVDNEHKKFFNNKNNRNTNPLEPNYGSVYGGYIEKSVSLNPYFHMKNRGRIYMSNDDIFGSISGSKNKYNLFLNKPNFAFDVKDIEGSKTGTLKRCSKNMILNRNSNPLIPKYEYLGMKENKANERYYKNNVDDKNNDNNDNNNNNEIINKNQKFNTLDINNIQKYNNNDIIEKFPSSKLNISKSCKDLYIPNKNEFPHINYNINNNNNINNNDNINNNNEIINNNQNFNSLDINNIQKYNNNNNQNFNTLDINTIQKYNNNDNLEKFPSSKLNISKSCKDLYIPNKNEFPHLKYNINNNNQNFNPENYKKPNPNYERIHNPLLLLGQKNRNNRLDVQMKKFFNINNNKNTDFINNNNNNMILKDSTLNDCCIDYTKKFNLMKSRSMENLNDDINNRYNNHLNLTREKIKKDPLYNRYRSPPSYEEQLNEFIKDNSYNFNE